MLRVNALSLIPHPHAKLPFVIPDFDFDLLRLCVLEGIAQCLAGIPVHFVTEDRMKVPRVSFKLGSIWVRFAGREFFTQSALSLAHARNFPVRPSLSEDAPFEMDARIRGKDGEDRWFFDPIQSATRPQPGETAF